MEDIKENKNEKTSTRGDRGEVGTGTPGSRLRAKWRAEGKGLSLKQFTRQLLKSGDTEAKTWFDSKKGKFNQKRSDKNLADARAAAAATKLKRRTKKAKDGGK